MDWHRTNLISHVFLPRKLELENVEELTALDFIELFIGSLSSISSQFPNTFSLLTDSHSIYHQKYFLHEDLKSAFENKNSLILYLPAQNSLFIAKPKDLDYQIDLYPSPISTKKIVFDNYSCQVPEVSYLLETPKITNSFIEQIISLQQTIFDDALPQARKKGEHFSDLHKAPSDTYVKDWFLPSLNLQINPDVISITKKINDEIIRISHAKNWRRNPFYISLKQVLHHQLVQEKREIGHLYYKLAIILVQHQILRKMEMDNQDMQNQLSDSGLLFEIHCKISNRIQKLKQADLSIIITELLRNIEVDLIERIQNDKLRHNKLLIAYEKRSLTTNVNIGDTIDITQSLKSSIPLINQILNNKIKPLEINSFRNYNPPPVLFQLNGGSVKQQKSYLYSLEIKIREMWLCKNVLQIKELWDFYINYDKLASKIYREEDVVSKGIQQLTLVTIVALIDFTIVRLYPYLKNYKNHIDLSNMRVILLPLQSQMKQLAELEVYFKERNIVRKQGPLVLCEDGAASKVYHESKSMQDLKERILQQEKENIKKKMIEKEILRQQRIDLKTRFMNYVVCDTVTKKRKKRIIHDTNKCNRCIIQNQLNLCNNIDRYEKLLPEKTWEQNAVIFEISMPYDISIWRDALFDILAKLKLLSVKNANLKLYDWKTNRLRPYFTSRTSQVSLHSTTASFQSRHSYILLDSNDSVVVPNGFNLNLSTTDNLIEFNKSFSSDFPKMADEYTYKIKDKSFSKLSKYCSLPGNENNIIASSSECPKEVNISDWISFGTLRAGDSLQYHNLLAFFHGEKLPFDKSGSAFLIMNTLWQVWTNDSKRRFRDAHDIINSNAVFTTELVNELKNYLKRINSQWEKPFCLINVSLAAIRCFILAKDSSLPSICVLLKEIRETGMKWINRINVVLDGVMSNENAEEKDKDKLRKKLCYVSFAVILTYFTDERVPTLLSQEGDFQHWIRALMELNRNYSPSESRRKLSAFYCLVQRIGFILYPILSRNISKYLSLFIAGTDLSGSLSDFGQWKEIENTGTFKCNKNNDDGSISIVEFNCLDGLLLVDGSPNNRLLPNFVKDESFQSLFGKSTVFDVTREGNILTTSKPYSGFFFRFFKIGSNLMIVEKSYDNSRELYLIPRCIMHKDLPIHFVQNYSHWLDPKKRIIYFRPKSFQHNHFFDLNKSKFILQSDNNGLWYFTENFLIETEKRTLVNYYGLQMQNVCRSVINSIESMENIHVWAKIGDKSQPSLEIELPRYDLTFTLNNNDKILRCNGRFVCANQSIGTLYGLVNYIKLESEDDSNYHELIIPHGEIRLSKVKGPRLIQINDHLSPPYFTFSLNKNLRRIEAPQSQEAWFYLAHLHAVTSLIYRDQFTGMTGTEQAIHILNLKICKSFNPYSELAQIRLKKILKLSPTRSFNPPHLKEVESVEWPEILPSIIASDVFALLATQLLDDSSLLKTTIIQSGLSHKKTDDKVESMEKDKLFLQKRAYWKSKKLYSSVTHLSNEFIEFQRMVPRSLRSRSDFNIVDQVAYSFYKEQPFKYTGFPKLSDWLKGSEPISLKDFEYSCCDWNDIACNIKDYYFSILKLIDDNRNNKSFLGFFISFIAFELRSNKSDLEKNMIAIASFINFSMYPGNVNLINFLLAHPFQFPSSSPSFFNASTLISRNCINSSSIYEFNRLKTIGVLPSNATDIDFLKLVQDESNYVQRELEIRIALIENLVKEKKELTPPPWNFPNQIPLLPTHCNTKHIVFTDEINNLLSNYYIDRLKLKVMDKVIESFNYLLLFDISSPIPSIINNQNINTTKYPRNIRDYYSKGDITIAFNEAMEILEKKHPKLPWMVTATKIDSKYDDKEFLDKLDSLKNFESQEVSEHFINDLKESWECPPPISEMNIEEDFIYKFPKLSGELEQFCNSKLQLLDELLQSVYHPPEFRLLEECNLLLPYTEQCFIPQLLVYNSKNDKRIKNVLIAITQLKVYLQKINRMKKLISKNNKSKFKQELISPEDSQVWNSRDYPSWLLFEFENNISIRPIQAKVAFQMLNPHSNQHSLLQLNMGEGKTAVITPIVAAHLADSKKSLVRVIVLPSLYDTNYSTLRYQLGRFLNHYIFTIPCARDHIIDNNMLISIFNIMKMAKNNGGIIVTVPEYIKSLQLKFFEACVNRKKIKKKINAKLFAECLNFEVNNAKDIIDEADAILHYKSQLIYTLGDQTVVDGHSNRWETITKLIKIVINICRNNQEFYKYVQVDLHILPYQFPDIRFLSKPSQEFIDTLKTEILSAFYSNHFIKLPTGKYKLLEEYARNPSLSVDLIQKIKELQLDQNQYEILNTVRGFIAFEIFVICFSRRWRVEYGVNQKQSRLMAVPFRGKDVAADQTEFGHPDVAITQTILAYYHSGLSHDQLSLCFGKLDHLEDAERNRIFIDWRSSIYDTEIKERIPTSFKNINLSDINQKVNLFSTLEKHIQVINFYLFRIVFPKEAKQFPSKITRNSWSHVEENRVNLVTGFSGTNDTSLLLPFNIIQNDLKELKGTNAHVLKCILNNNSYSSLPREITADLLIEKLIKGHNGKMANVLLDVGALVIELSNEKVAKKWLLLRKDAKGVVYFCSKKNELVVLSRSGKVKPLYHYNTQNELTKDFLVYLDEIHTRGTDLVLPDGSIAVVTLGARVTKDKFVQGCMRMRKLGKEHSLSFWASDEVDLEIKSLLQDNEEVTSSHIILWVIRNSIRAIVDGFTLWGSQAINHMHIRNLIAEVGNVFPGDLTNIKKFGRECITIDSIPLQEMYGRERQEQTIADLIRDWSLQRLNKKEISKYDEDFIEKIYQKCKKYVGNIKTFAQLLSEEQERELEAEAEEEKFTERPPPFTAHIPTFNNAILRFFNAPQANISVLTHVNIMFPLSYYFRDSNIITPNLRKVYEHDSRLFCTNEFCITVTDRRQPDSALRSPSWCMITRKNDRSGIDSIVLLAPHEANELMKSRNSSLVSLHRFISRTTPHQSLLIENESISVPLIPFKQGEKEDLKKLAIELSLFAGSLYFQEISDPKLYFDEQKLTAAYLGVCPRPFSNEEECAFENGKIKQNGFILPYYRRYCNSNNNNNNNSSFKAEPHEFVAGLFKIRGSINNYALSDIGRLLTNVKFIEPEHLTFNDYKYLTVDNNKKEQIVEEENEIVEEDYKKEENIQNRKNKERLVKSKKENNISLSTCEIGENILRDACRNRIPPILFEDLISNLKSKSTMRERRRLLQDLDTRIGFLDVYDYITSLRS